MFVVLLVLRDTKIHTHIDRHSGSFHFLGQGGAKTKLSIFKTNFVEISARSKRTADGKTSADYFLCRSVYLADEATIKIGENLNSLITEQSDVAVFKALSNMRYAEFNGWSRDLDDLVTVVCRRSCSSSSSDSDRRGNDDIDSDVIRLGSGDRFKI